MLQSLIHSSFCWLNVNVLVLIHTLQRGTEITSHCTITYHETASGRKCCTTECGSVEKIRGLYSVCLPKKDSYWEDTFWQYCIVFKILSANKETFVFSYKTFN